MRIETPRLLLRPFEAADAAPLRQLVTRAEVGRMLVVFPPRWTRAEASAFVAREGRCEAPPFRLAILHEGAFAGSIGVGEGAEPPIFYFLAPELAGQGLAGEAVEAFCAALFEAFGMVALSAEVFTDNPASARVLEKAGFLRLPGEGVVKSAARATAAPVWRYRRAR